MCKQLLAGLLRKGEHQIYWAVSIAGKNHGSLGNGDREVTSENRPSSNQPDEKIISPGFVLRFESVRNFHRVCQANGKMKSIGLCQLQAKIMVVLVVVTGK